jgi:hypothetical protein
MNQSQVPSSIDILETFYGETLSRDLEATIRSTPVGQLEILCRQLARHNRNMELVLRADRSADEQLSQRFASLRTGTFSLHGEIYLAGGREFDIGQREDFWHTVMTCERVIIPDRMLDAARDFLLIVDTDMGPESSSIFSNAQREVAADRDSRLAAVKKDLSVQRDKIARNAAKMVPVAPLIRAGILIPIASAPYFSFEGHGMDDAISGAASLHWGPMSLFCEDPYLAWIMARRVMQLPRWQAEALQIDARNDPRTAAQYLLGFEGGGSSSDSDLVTANAITKLMDSYGERTSLSQAQDAVTLGYIHRHSGIKPLTSNRSTMIHMCRSSMALIEGFTEDFVGNFDPFVVAAQYGMPNLRHVATRDLVQLRLNEEIYSDFRLCMERLIHATAEGQDIAGGFDTYQRIVHERADDIVRPTYERFETRRRKNKLASTIVGYAAGGAVSLALNGVAAILSGVPSSGLHTAGNAIANATKEKSMKAMQRNLRDLDTACSIMATIVRP